MTDGIIQEVFKQYYNIYVTDLDQLNMLVNLQSKLIKKIKQEIKPELNCGCDSCIALNNCCRRLIGDNE